MLVSVRQLTKRFPVRVDFWGRPTSWLSAVEDVSFDIRSGETLGLVGETGSGKSTLAQLLLRMTPVTAGEVYFRGENVLTASRRQMSRLRQQMQIIFQDPYSSLDPRMTVGAIVAEGMHHLRLNGKQRQLRVRQLLDTVGLAGRYVDRYPHQLSGGERQRVAIARALGVGPEFLILDEPASALDVSIQSQVLNLLRDLQKELKLTYLFISHDLSVVKHVSDRIAVMYLGKVVELASKEGLFANPLHPYTQALLSAIPGLEGDAKRSRRIILQGEIPSPIDPPPRCRFAGRCFRSIAICHQQEPPLEPVSTGSEHTVACFNYAALGKGR